MIMRWSEEETINFVKFYFNHELLWNMKHPDYKTRDKREAAYSEISKEFRAYSGILLDTDEVKSKIKNLRSTYTQEITKILRKSNTARPYRPSLKWFSKWHKHLKNLPNSRLKDISIEDLVDDAAPRSESWFVDEAIDDQEMPNSDSFLSENESLIFIVKPEPNVPRIKREQPETPQKTKKRKMKLRSSDRKDKVELSQDTSTATKEDEFDIYGKYIASQLRKMELNKALKVQLAIQSLVSDARITD